MYQKTDYQSIQKHIDENSKFLKINSNDIYPGEGYEYKNNSDAPLFGCSWATNCHLAAFYHEYSHAIEIAETEPERLLNNYYNLNYKTTVNVFGVNYDSPITSQATERECRVIAIQAKLYSHIFKINEKEALETTVNEMLSSLRLMEDRFLIPIKNKEESLNNKEKERDEYCKNYIEKYYNNLSINWIIEKIEIVSDYRNYKNWPNEKLEKNAFHYVYLEDLKEYVNPYSPWIDLESPITEEEIQNCLNNQEEKLIETPLWIKLRNKQERIENREKHIQKIAYFVKNPPNKPISIDVGIPSMHMPSYIIEDGNHRLAASFFKQRKMIKAFISGESNFIKEMNLYGPNVFERELEKRYEKNELKNDNIKKLKLK